MPGDGVEEEGEWVVQAALLVQLAVHAGPHLEAARLEARLHVHHPLDHAPVPHHNSEGYTVKKGYWFSRNPGEGEFG